jgi:hypothetical protein
MAINHYLEFFKRVMPEIALAVAMLDWQATFNALMTGSHLA